MSTRQDDLHAMRHSLAHIMATATMKLWPEARLGVGPVVENGFYYDIDIPGVTISESDFKKIEKEMYKVINRDEPFVQSNKSIDEALEWAQESSQPYKEELLNDLRRSGTTVAKDLSTEEMGTLAEGDSQLDTVGFYANGDFTDLCRGPHVESTGKVGAFKLMRVAGAYWRGNEKNPQMQRLYGVAFANKEDLKAHLTMLEEAKKRDHRKLGKELDLYVMSDLVGAGLPMFTPRGTWLRELLGRYSQQLRENRISDGFERVWTPNMTKYELYERSGHWSKFGDELFLVTSQETSDKLVLKPMNCPHHTRIYESKLRSYKDLPIRYMENTIDYRDEKSGELHGLSRVRSMTQDDSHVFCRDDQIEHEATQLVLAAKGMYETLGMDIKFHLSFRDESDGYLGAKELWSKAQDQIKQVAENNGLDYVIDEGEAAFYGPKIDFIVTDALGREWQTATVQLDFVQPSSERFNLTYTDEDGSKKHPVMIHCALLGTIERFLSVYIEHTAGRFPFWLAPEQVRILTINDNVLDYVDDVQAALVDIYLMSPLKYNEIRFSLDSRSESLSKKIREATKMKVPLMIIIGERDKADRTVSLRTQQGEQTIPLSDLASAMKDM